MTNLSENDVAVLSYYTEKYVAENGLPRPAALKAADDLLWERGWFVPRREAPKEAA